MLQSCVFYISPELNIYKDEILNRLNKKITHDIGIFLIDENQHILYNALLFKKYEDYHTFVSNKLTKDNTCNKDNYNNSTKVNTSIFDNDKILLDPNDLNNTNTKETNSKCN